MRLNSVRAGMLTGLAIFLVPVLLAILFAPPESERTGSGSGGFAASGYVISPPPTDFEAMANAPQDTSVRGRIERLLGSFEPERDHSGDVIEEEEIAAEQRLAHEWCARTIAKHANITERQASVALTTAMHFPEAETTNLVLTALESVPESDAEDDLVRRRQCAALLYLGMMGSPPSLAH